MEFAKILLIVLVFVSVMVSVIAFPQNLAADDQAAESRDKRQYNHGVTGPVLTFVKTDKNANYKWGVRHHVGHKYGGKR